MCKLKITITSHYRVGNRRLLSAMYIASIYDLLLETMLLNYADVEKT